MTDTTRASWLPDVPAMPELGYPQSVMSAWIALYGPAGIAPERVATLSDAFVKAVNSPEIRTQWPSSGTNPQAQNAATLKAFTSTEIERYRHLVELTGAKAE